MSASGAYLDGMRHLNHDGESVGSSEGNVAGVAPGAAQDASPADSPKVGGAPNADKVLRAHGMDGAALMKLSYQAANTYAKQHPSFKASRIEDLAQHCSVQVCRRAPNYRAELNTGFRQELNPRSTPFRSWCWQQMEQACQDFVRQRKEGFVGRIGRDKEVTVQLTATPEDHFVEAQTPDEFELAMDERRLKSWARAAAQVGLTVPEWLAITADHAARDLLEHAP